MDDARKFFIDYREFQGEVAGNIEAINKWSTRVQERLEKVEDLVDQTTDRTHDAFDHLNALEKRLCPNTARIIELEQRIKALEEPREKTAFDPPNNMVTIQYKDGMTVELPLPTDFHDRTFGNPHARDGEALLQALFVLAKSAVQ